MITFLGSDESEREKGSMKVRERKECSERHTWENRVDTVELEKSARDNGYASIDRDMIWSGGSWIAWSITHGMACQLWQAEANRSQREFIYSTKILW